MSEQLLKAIIRLFAILARVDGITFEEINSIKNFLLSRLNIEAATQYFKLFNSIVDEYDKEADQISPERKKDNEAREIEKISHQINTELTHQQKIVLILDVITLTIADGKISSNEEKLVARIANAIKVDSAIIKFIKLFALAKKPSDLGHKNFLIIAATNKNNNDQVNYINLPNLVGFIAVLELEHFTGSYFLKYVGDSAIYLNNIPINSGDMRMIPPGSTIRGENIKPIYYSDVISSYKQYKIDQNISFVAENIEFRFKTGTGGLRNINIRETSGTLFGIMGSSGSGKSTLLNVLNGNDKPDRGRVSINGINIHNDKKGVEGVLGYVPQDDLLIEELTVYQNLFYAAKLCFTNLTDHEFDDLVNHTLASLGLSDIRELKVGSPLMKAISGGQRKRLNIGLELLREPAILFVDEPTSGLSSRDSENIMDLLKELTLKGKLIFVVIHQPSSDIYKLFDKLVILDDGGYQIYYGNPVEAVVYFKDAFNLVESEHGTCITCGNVNPEQIFNIIETKVVNEFGKLTKERKITPVQWHDIFQKRIKIKNVSDSTDRIKSSLRIPNRLKQFQIFSTRDFLSKISNRQYLAINLLEAPALAFILAYIVKYFPDTLSATGSDYHFSTNVNIPAYIFMSIIVALFMGLTVSAEEIFRDQKILKRESFLNLSRSSYLYSKLFILFTISAIQTLSYTLIGNQILEIKDMFLPFWLILFSTSCFANVLGLNISSAFNSAVTIYILIPVLLIPQLLLSGVVVKFDELNPKLSTQDKVPLIGEFMATRWSFEAAMVTQFRYNLYERPFYELDQKMSNSEFKNLYYIPNLISKLDYCHQHYTKSDPIPKAQVENNLKLLQYEIGNELTEFGKEHLPEVIKLNPEEFNEDTYQKTHHFLLVIKKIYIRRYNDALKAKEEILQNLSDSPKKRIALENLKKKQYNARIEDMVKNSNDAIRIVEHNHKLIQKIYPIFLEQKNPSYALDFRTTFYAPTKHIFGKHINTLWFNLGMLWFMSIVLVITLYFDLLRKLIEIIGNVTLRKQYIEE